jgi:DNA-binding transcriptional ArsR family regulator
VESGIEGAARPISRLDAGNVATVAATLHALATPSRLLILAQLRHGPLKVTALAEAVGMRQPIVSQHLGVLRTVGLVASVRHGPSVIYRLADEHVAELLDEIVHHTERLQAKISTP